MTASFCAYIDESGDEGFQFRTDLSVQRSSDWFVLGAFITRKQDDLDTVKIIDQVRQEFDIQPKKHVHWKKLKHPQKVRYAQILTGLHARTIGVCVHKPSLLEPEKFKERYFLYFYAVRCLLERLSWLARDSHNPVKWGGDGTVEILFSHRYGMSYEEMKEYLKHLEIQKENGQDIRIEFQYTPIHNINAQTPGRSMGLQLADACAGAFFNGLERDPYGNTEPRYIQTLKPILYKHKGSSWGYGIKVLPKEAIKNLKEEISLEWIWSLK